MNEYYGTVEEGNEYFAARLHSKGWSRANADRRQKALVEATSLIEGLNYKGHKHAVYELLQVNPLADADEIADAEASQPLQFPRGPDTEVPLDIRQAVYLIADALLNNRDPEMELEHLSRTSIGISSVRSTYNRDQVPPEHTLNMIPSAVAWRLIRPYLRDDMSVRVYRAS